MDANRTGGTSKERDADNPDDAAGDASEQVACIAHDLKSPLGAIRIVASLLRDRLLDHDSRLVEAIQILERNVAYMDRLTHDVEDISRFDHGCLQLHYEPVDLAGLLRSVQLRALLDASRIWIQVSTDVPVRIMADAIRIERVLVNLIENALKHTSSAVVVGVERRGDHARITVCDKGPGVPREDAVSIFDIHRQLQSALSLDGAGLGLYSSRRIVEAHGGTIGVETIPGPGACFYVELPVQPWMLAETGEPMNAS